MKLALVSLLLLTSTAVIAEDKVVYGEDDRVNISEMPPQYKQWARSTAAMIPKSKISKGFFLWDWLGFTENYKIKKTPNLTQSQNICSDQNFGSEITAASCTGFLVKPNVIVTAGHCIPKKADCKNNYWVFDYTQKVVQGQKKPKIMKRDVYRCKRVLHKMSDYYSDADYAVIELTKKVKGRTPLKLERAIENISVGEEIAVIGTPSGLPLKYAENAKVRSLEQKFFVTNLDTFGGNSGSPVFSKKSGKVIGILVRGEEDYISAPGSSCNRVKVCASDGCRGEDVTYSGVLPQF